MTQRLLGSRYQLGPVLGRGGMSEVRRGDDTLLGRSVAIKILRDVDPASVARFEREARVLAQLQHPNVVTVFDAGADGDFRYIVMELVEGPTLREVLGASKHLAPDRAASIAAEIADALAYAHGRGIVHRDVKPSNVLLASGENVKLADLGIAKLLSSEATATTGVIGTAQYISPEQARGDPVDGRSDLYSLGCVLFEMLVGRPPFEGDAAALTYAHVHLPAPRVRSLRPDVAEGLDMLVASLLEKEPSARPQRAEAVRPALDGAMDGAIQEGTAPPGDSTERLGTLVTTVETPPLGSSVPTRRPPLHGPLPPRRWILPAAGAALLSLLLLAIVPVLTRDSERGRRAGAGTTWPSASSRATKGSHTPPPAPLTPQEAAQRVFDVVSEGIAAGEVTGGITGEVQHKVDEALRELVEHEDLEKALDKIIELRDKVAEALEKGEITNRARAHAINATLEDLAEALRAQAQR